MASTALQISAFLLTLVGLAILISATVSIKWKISSTSTAVITANWIFEGLWMHCAATALGSVQCKKFASIFSLPGHVQACRALMIIALVLGLLAMVLSLFGLRCTKVGSNDEYTKGKIALSGGLVFILGGLSSMVAVSWYAGMITVQFYDPLYGGIKYELGDALYLGWAGSLLLMLGGAFLTCSCKREKTGKTRHFRYDYTANQHTAPTFKERNISESTGCTKAYV
ncbi:claudin-7-like isoform X1 [Ambystoma mexicanum]|uniref:claudin-7-like isoform X1 n=1 Tax=Ambystoma mexicanum TaxID=8296 RepID=UPI0037E9798D